MSLHTMRQVVASGLIAVVFICLGASRVSALTLEIRVGGGDDNNSSTNYLEIYLDGWQPDFLYGSDIWISSAGVDVRPESSTRFTTWGQAVVPGDWPFYHHQASDIVFHDDVVQGGAGVDLQSEYSQMLANDPTSGDDRESWFADQWNTGGIMEADGIFVGPFTTVSGRVVPAGSVLVAAGSLSPEDGLIARIGYTIVPEPISSLLMGLGIIGVIARRKARA